VEVPLDGGSLAESPLSSSGRLVGERAGRFYFLAPSQVDYIEADSNYLHIYTGKDHYINRDSLRRLAPLLEQHGFFRISRSILINLRRVEFAERAGGAVLAFVLSSGVRLLSAKGYRIAAGAELRLAKRNAS
jgi:two-component system, LytTR family, response regulator